MNNSDFVIRDRDASGSVKLKGNVYFCHFCEVYGGNEINNECHATSPESGLGCTRDNGHEGDHAACGISSDEHPFETWRQE